MPRVLRTISSKFSKPSSSSARTSSPAICRRRSRILLRCRSWFHRVVPLPRRRATAPSPRPSASSPRHLQSGNLSAAQQDYTTIQQDFQNQATQNQTQETEGHHHHHGGGGSSEISQLLDQLGTALQSGNVSSAQSTFNTLQQALTQNTAQTSAQSSSNGVSVTA